MQERDRRRERLIREIIKEGLAGCPPTTVDAVREIAHAAADRHGVSRRRADEMISEERARADLAR